MNGTRGKLLVTKPILYAAFSAALLSATLAWSVTVEPQHAAVMNDEIAMPNAEAMCVSKPGSRIITGEEAIRLAEAMNADHAMHQADSMGGDHVMHRADGMNGDHATHAAMAKSRKYTLKTVDYPVLDVTLQDKSGALRQLSEVLGEGQPIALNFIFTTCTTICPVMTATFSQMRRELGEESARRIRMVSISIDPEYDRPDVLQAYAKKFGADEEWKFLTGDSQDIVNVLRSFDVYAGSKANHLPVTLLRGENGGAWTRIDGIASGRELARLARERILN